jgi:predicted DNA-binding transcriptional regulator YafY
MRHERAAKILEMAQLLAGTAEGLTLDELCERLDEERRTVERMRDAVRQVFPQLEVLDDPPYRRFRIPSGLDALFQTPTAEELAALRRAADSFSAQKLDASAASLRSLERKLLSALRGQARRKLAPDVEALIEAEAIAVHAGPRPFEDEAVLGGIREAILSGRALGFDYHGGSSPGRRREVVPYGLLFGRSNYLVAVEEEGEPPRKWRLDRMRNVAVGDRRATRPADFSLQAYADESFGIYRDEMQDVVLRITPEGADDALGWRFHAGQRIEPQADGSVRVTFRAAGMLELAWHLFTWGDKVEVVQPAMLRETLVTELQRALAVHGRRNLAVA